MGRRWRGVMFGASSHIVAAGARALGGWRRGRLASWVADVIE
jgi:hypothetical protein